MKKLTLDNFMEYRFLSGLKFSPSGDRAALVAAKANREQNSYDGAIWLSGDDGFFQLTGLNKERSFFWEDDTHILFPAARSDSDRKKAELGYTTYYRISTQGGEALPAFVLPLAGASMKQIGPELYAVTAELDTRRPDFHLLSEKERSELLEADKKDADYQVLTEAPFYLNGAGYIDRKRSALYLYHKDTGELRRLSQPTVDVGSVTRVGSKLWFTGDNKIHISNFESGLYAYDLETGDCISVPLGERTATAVWNLGGRAAVAAAEKPGYRMDKDEAFFWADPEGLIPLADSVGSLGNSTGSDCRLGGGRAFQETEEGLYMVLTQRNASGLYLLRPDGSLETLLSREGSVDDFHVSAKGDIWLTGLFGTDLQEVYALRDGKLTCLSAFNRDVLEDVYRAPYEKLTISSQGWDIDGWVLRPKDFDETKRYPAILDIHGGPRTVYGELFYHEMQYWANEGWFVFFCNPVGSSGRGDDFADIGGRYGQTDYANIMDFTDAVLEKYPMIDRDRVACTGGSYGGYMSNWILTHTDRFAAIATQRSISNWLSFYGVSDIGFVFCKTQNAADIYTQEGVEKLWDQSPMKYIANAKTPTLLIHSTEDYRCPMEQAMQLFTALRERGVPTRMCCFKGENHDLSRSGKPLHRIRRLQEITDWIAAYTKGGKLPE